MTPVLIIDDQSRRQTYLNMWAAIKPHLQNIVTLYDALGLDPLTPTDFPKLFSGLDVLLFDKITGGSLNIGDVPLNKGKALDIVEKPAGYPALLEAINLLRENIKNNVFSYDAATHATFNLANITQYFVLDGNNVIQLSATLQTQLNNQFKVYATSDKAIGMAEVCKAATDKFFELGLQNHWLGHLGSYKNTIADIIGQGMSGLDVANEKPVYREELSRL